MSKRANESRSRELSPGLIAPTAAGRGEGVARPLSRTRPWALRNSYPRGPFTPGTLPCKKQLRRQQCNRLCMDERREIAESELRRPPPSFIQFVFLNVSSFLYFFPSAPLPGPPHRATCRHIPRFSICNCRFSFSSRPFSGIRRIVLEKLQLTVNHLHGD
jgi:hypothetical protein